MKWLYFLLISFSSAFSEQLPNETPFYLEANEIIYHQNTNTVTATGNVHIRQYVAQEQGWRHIYADNLSYQKNFHSAGKISAAGKVWLHEPNGDVWQTDSLEFTDQFDQGLTTNMKLVTQDQSRLSALKSDRSGNQTHFEGVDYSPCKVCVLEHCQPEHSKRPLWQLRAAEVTHDQESQTITYHHARLEIKGVPVLYFPYFSHPDPKVKRKSGLLFPVYGVSKDLGMMLSLPVYYVIAPNRDLTVTPIFTGKQGGIIAAEYRHRFHDGEAKFAGSYTRTQNLPQVKNPPPNGPRQPKPDRWHILGKTHYELNKRQRLWIDVNRASDTTYLTRYPINRQTPNFIQHKNLTSTLTFEQFETNSYFGVQNYSFQTDTPKTTPLVAPMITFHHQMTPDKARGTFSVEGSFLSVSRQLPVAGRQATQMQRASTGVYWKLPYITEGGYLVTAKLGTRGDGYYTRHYQSRQNVGTDNSPQKMAVRVFPQSSLDWRYPLTTTVNQMNWLLQPMTTILASPVNKSTKNIPNEDSTIFELDDTNLFQLNRFNGIDRTDSGYRVVYGFDNEFLFPQQRSISLFVGQSRRLDSRQVVPDGLWEDNKKSDYIGCLKVKPVSWLMARYRVSIHPEKRQPRYSELGMSLGEKFLKLDVGYVYLNKAATIKKQDLSQMNWQLSSQVFENWSLSFAQIKNLKKGQGGNALASFILASYKDECFQLDAGVYKTSYRDRDIRPDSGFLLQLVFRNLGAFSPMTAPKYPGSMLTAF